MCDGTYCLAMAASAEREMRPIVAAGAVAESVRRANRCLVEADGLRGGTRLVGGTVRLFGTAYRRLAALPASPARRDLAAATAETAEIGGWLAFDADRHGLARRLSHEALALARLAGDTGMERFTLSNLALLDIHVHRPSEAFQIAEHVLDGRLPRRVRALFEMRLARALGQYGEKRRALGLIGRARARHGDGPGTGDPPWAWWIDPGEIRWHEAMVHADLGEWGRAADLFARTTGERLGPRLPRPTFNDQSNLLRALVHANAWGDAERVLTAQVLPTLGAVSSGRTANLLGGLIPALTAERVPAALHDAAPELRRGLRATRRPH